jgi:hypothetical protein
MIEDGENSRKNNNVVNKFESEIIKLQKILKKLLKVLSGKGKNRMIIVVCVEEEVMMRK